MDQSDEYGHLGQRNSGGSRFVSTVVAMSLAASYAATPVVGQPLTMEHQDSLMRPFYVESSEDIGDKHGTNAPASLLISDYAFDDDGSIYGDLLLVDIEVSSFSDPPQDQLDRIAFSDRERNVLRALLVCIEEASNREYVKVTETTVEVVIDPEEDNREYHVTVSVPLTSHEAMKYWGRMGRAIEIMQGSLAPYEQAILTERFAFGVEWDA